MKGIKSIAFDCDGVMFDTEQSNRAYYNHLLDHFDLPAMTPEQFRFIHMHTVKESIPFLFENKIEMEKVNAYRLTLDYLPFISEMEMEPYLKPLIRRIRPFLKTAVATNRTDSIEMVIQMHGLTGYFDAVVSAGDVVHPKPHPDLLIKILRNFGINPQEMLYVGDSKLDEIAAHRANVGFIAYGNTDLAADFHIQSLREIEGIIGLQPC